jgi:glycerol-3-phosphate cytidylyltransferase
MKKYKKGMTTGTYDMFHAGHLNLLKGAKSLCDTLIVGIYNDEQILQYKGRIPIIGLEDRMSIIDAVKYVDKVIALGSLDKVKAWEKERYDVLIIGDDWKGHSRWIKTEEEMNKLGVDVVYLPYTKGISSSIIKRRIIKQGK